MIQSPSSIRRRSHYSRPKEDNRPRQCNDSYDAGGKGHFVGGGSSQKSFHPSSRRRVSWSDDPPTLHFIPSDNKGRKPVGRSPTRKPRRHSTRNTSRSTSTCSSPPSHGMADPDYHWFLGGSGDDDDLMGFPGMWNQNADTDDDRGNEDIVVDTSIVGRLPRDMVVATALLLFGLWRLSS